MGFWRGMSQGFEQGVPLGVRAADRAEEKRRWEIENTREEAREGRQKTSHDQQIQLGKKQLESADLELQAGRDQARQKNFRRVYITAKALADDGDEEAAGSMISQAYNKMVNNGDEVRLIFKKHKPDDEVWKKSENKDANILVLSKTNGLRRAKTMSDILKSLKSYADDPDKFFEHERQERAKVDDLNAQEKPFRGKDNRLYVRKWSLTASNGKQAEIVPYTGQEPMSAIEQTINAVKELVDRKTITGEEGRIALGFSKAESPSERVAARKSLSESGARAMKDALDIRGKQLDQQDKRLALVLKPFGVTGETIIDEFGNMTNDGNSALNAALQLIEKRRKWNSFSDDEQKVLLAGNSPKREGSWVRWTTEDERKLPYAQKAIAIYEQISEAVAPTKPAGGEAMSVMPPAKDHKGRTITDTATGQKYISDGSKWVPKTVALADVEAEAKRRGFVKGSDGKWKRPVREGLNTHGASGGW